MILHSFCRSGDGRISLLCIIPCIWRKYNCFYKKEGTVLRDPKLTFLIRCAYGAVWLALIWLMVRYVLVWLLPFLIALALAALLEPAVVLCRRRPHLRRGFTATVLSLVVLGTVAAGLVLAGHGAAAAGL